MTSFSMSTYQNEYVQPDATEMHAIVTVTADRAGTGPAPASAAELVLVDVSGSMGVPRSKIRSARDATIAAIDVIRDGVSFGVIAGAGDARLVYPDRGRLAVASDRTRSEARAVARKLKAGGGTAIGEWLLLADQLVRATGAELNHAILLTDGQDEGETPEELDEAIRVCEGAFQCDCRGVGTDWHVAELREIATALLGTVDIIAAAEDMPGDFAAMMRSAMAKSVGDVRLRVWAPQGSSVRFVKQVAPTIVDLTEMAMPVNELTSDYPTGAWGEESRDYHVCIGVQPLAVGDEALAGRISLVVDGNVGSQSLVKVVWTDDAALSTQINREVAHYTGQAELAHAIQDGLAARRRGDDDVATVKLGRAVQLATQTGNDATLKLLVGVVDIDDADRGTVRLRRDIDAADEMTLDTRSTRTTRIEVGD